MNPAHTTNFTGIRIPLSKIESEFKKIWEQTLDKDNQSSAFKASTLNLVITSNNRLQFENILGIIPDITKNHPGRIIMILLDPKHASEQVVSNITAFCHPPREDGKQICCELITLETGRLGEKHLSGILLPLLLSDLPVFLYSPDNLVLTSSNMSFLNKSIERVILDSPDIFPDQESLHTLISQVIKTSEYSKISDLQWSRLTPWREALARMFDGASGAEHLQSISQVRISYKGQGYSSTALYLAGWLASRLNWTVTDCQIDTALLMALNSPHDNSIQIELVADGTDVQTGQITKIEMVTGESSNLIKSAESDKDQIKIQTTQNDKSFNSDKIPNKPLSQTWLVGNELDFVRADTIYLASIDLLWNALNIDKGNANEVY